MTVLKKLIDLALIKKLIPSKKKGPERNRV